jgi:branched-chain amino acid transport system substrate-binding protein
LKALKEKNPDAFLGITYPPDTILVSKQAKEIGFNPKIFYAAVGTAFPLYKAQLAADTEGVMGMGSWNAKTSAAAKDYFAAHVAKFQKEPDRWASAHAYASLQILQQAVERVGLDRAKIREAIAGGEFETILGPIKFKDGMNASIPGTVSQWQKGEFEVVWPKARATAQLVAPKPAWRHPVPFQRRLASADFAGHCLAHYHLNGCYDFHAISRPNCRRTRYRRHLCRGRHRP